MLTGLGLDSSSSIRYQSFCLLLNIRPFAFGAQALCVGAKDFCMAHLPEFAELINQALARLDRSPSWLANSGSAFPLGK